MIKVTDNANDLNRLSKCYSKRDVDIKIKYYQVPKFLIVDTRYKSLGLGEKLLYSVLRDRLSLSINNNWVDNNGYVYLRYDQKKLACLLCIDRKTVHKYLRSLESHDLIVVISEGKGLSNRIYITDISKDLNSDYFYEDKGKLSENQGQTDGGEKLPEGIGKESTRGDGEKLPMIETDTPSETESLNLSDRLRNDTMIINDILINAKIYLFPKDKQELIKQTVEDIYFSVDNFCKEVSMDISTIRERLSTLNINALDVSLHRIAEKIESGEKIHNFKKYYRKILWNSITDSVFYEP